MDVRSAFASAPGLLSMLNSFPTAANSTTSSTTQTAGNAGDATDQTSLSGLNSATPVYAATGMQDALGLAQQLASGFSLSQSLRTSFLQISSSTAAGLLDSTSNSFGGLNATSATDDDDLLSSAEMDPMMRKMSLLIDMLSNLDEDAGKNQLKQMRHFLQAMHKALGGSSSPAAAAQAAGQRAAAQSSQAQARATQIAQQGFTFEIEVRQSVSLDVAVAQLNEQGMQAAAVHYESEQVTRLRVTVGGVQTGDPVVIDLNRDGALDLTGSDDAEGTAFDLNADGKVDQSGFVGGSDALLAWDRNGNGTIDDGSELFGDQHGAANGLEELRRYDDNTDGRIDASDAIYKYLVALHDKNGDAKVALNETTALSKLGIKALDLAYQQTHEETAEGHVISAVTSAEYADGRNGLLADVDLRYQ